MILRFLFALIGSLWFAVLEPAALFLACVAGFTWAFHWLFSLGFR